MWPPKSRKIFIILLDIAIIISHLWEHGQHSALAEVTAISIPSGHTDEQGQEQKPGH